MMVHMISLDGMGSSGRYSATREYYWDRGKVVLRVRTIIVIDDDG